MPHIFTALKPSVRFIAVMQTHCDLSNTSLQHVASNVAFLDISGVLRDELEAQAKALATEHNRARSEEKVCKRHECFRVAKLALDHSQSFQLSTDLALKSAYNILLLQTMAAMSTASTAGYSPMVDVMRLALDTQKQPTGAQVNHWLLLLDPDNPHLQRTLQQRGETHLHLYLICDLSQPEKHVTQRLCPALSAFYREINPSTTRVASLRDGAVNLKMLQEREDGAFFRSPEVA
jgi:hypothetical protein